MQRGQQEFVLKREHHLDDAGHSGCCLAVAQLGFGRAEVERSVGAAGWSKDLSERPGFDGIAEPGASPMGLDGVDVRRRNARSLEGVRDHPLLRGTVGALSPGFVRPGSPRIRARGPEFDPLRAQRPRAA